MRALLADTPRLGSRIDAGGKEDLVGVDVSEAGYDILVEKRGFDRTTAAAEPFVEFSRSDLKRFGAPAARLQVPFYLRGGNDKESSETALIVEAEALRTIIKNPFEMVVLFARRAIVNDGESTGHTEVRQYGLTARQVDENPLSTTANGFDFDVGGGIQELSVAGFYDVRLPDTRMSQAPAGELFLQGADDGFDFGEFRHSMLSSMYRMLPGGATRKHIDGMSLTFPVSAV